MKQCPTCRTTYTDESLHFCLADGSTLVVLHGDEATLVSPKREPMRIDAGMGAHSAHVPPSSPSVMKIVAVVGLFGFFIIAAAGIAGALLYFNRDTRR
ncbi:MAG TPA: hypothetical protein VJL58_07210, partial [Pyrinomonadaceae bacterium]|nr:hypothetical protein [Pyrinomonadaceae bacterium]